MADELYSIDVRQWARDGLLVEGEEGQWAWRSRPNDPLEAGVFFGFDGQYVTLQYKLNGRIKCELLSICTTPCGFGGERKWFECPSCKRRIAIVYLRSAGFACRTCAAVSYGSQREDHILRMGRRQVKLEERLGGLWTRPRGMHEKTFSAIKWKIIQLEVAREDAIDAEIGRRGWAQYR